MYKLFWMTTYGYLCVGQKHLSTGQKGIQKNSSFCSEWPIRHLKPLGASLLKKLLKNIRTRLHIMTDMQGSILSRRSIIQLFGLAGVGASLFPQQVTQASSTSVNALKIQDFGAVPDIAANNIPAIQAAIDALPAEGGTVLIPAGKWGVTYTEVDGIQLSSNVHLTGVGEASELVVNAQTTRRTHVVRNRDWYQGNQHCRVSNLTINCQGYGQDSSANSWGINGVTFANSMKCSVENLQVLDGRGYGIWLFNSEHCRVMNCYVQDFSDDIELSNNACYNVIQGNIISSTGRRQWSSSGIIAYNHANFNTITSNVITGGFGQGITTASPYGAGHGNVFAGNVLDLYNAVGLLISGERNTFANNYVKTFLQPSLLFDDRDGPILDTTIQGNTLEADVRWANQPRKAAIVLTPMTSSVLISGNTVVSYGGECVRLSGTDVTLQGNQLRTVDTTLSDGVRCSALSRALILGNQVHARDCLVVEDAEGLMIGTNLWHAERLPVVGLQ